MWDTGQHHAWWMDQHFCLDSSGSKEMFIYMYQSLNPSTVTEGKQHTNTKIRFEPASKMDQINCAG